MFQNKWMVSKLNIRNWKDVYLIEFSNTLLFSLFFPSFIVYIAVRLFVVVGTDWKGKDNKTFAVCAFNPEKQYEIDSYAFFSSFDFYVSIDNFEKHINRRIAEKNKGNSFRSFTKTEESCQKIKCILLTLSKQHQFHCFGWVI